MINVKTAKWFCRDDISKIENYDKAIADPTQTWHCHHRLELTLDGEFALTPEQLKIHDMYYHRPYYELIFLTPAEHIRIHHKGRSSWCKGKKFTKEHCRKISEANKGRIVTTVTRKKISEANKGKLKDKKFTEEHRKRIAEANKGKQCMKGELNPMYGRHHSEESRRKMSEAAKRRCAARH